MINLQKKKISTLKTTPYEIYALDFIKDIGLQY